MFDMECEPLGPAQKTKKGNGIRKYLVHHTSGEKSVVSVWAQNIADLAENGIQSMSVRPGDMVFLAE